MTSRPTSRRKTFALKAGVHALLAAGFFGAAAQHALADPDDNAAAPATGPSQPQMLPEVSVTDQRAQGFAPKSVQTGPYNGLDALSVPATVNVVTRAVMDAQGDTGLYDALRNVAGVTRQQLSGLAYDNLSIRGIPLDNRASYYFDGVLPVDNNIWMPLEDKERIEVLKGASALYYGFAAPAGIVNMVPKRAGADPVSNVTLLGDSHGSYGAHVDLARRFGTDNQFGVRLNAMDEHVDTSIDGDTGYRRFISAAFDWRVTHSLTLQYDVEHIDTSIVEQAGIVPLPANKQGVIVLPRVPDPTKLLSAPGFPTRASADVNLFRGNYAVSDNWNVNFDVGQSITRRNRWNWVFQKYNVTTGAGTVQATQQNGQEYMDQTVRLETNGVFKTGSIAHDITIGVSQDWLYQPNFTSFTFTARQNLFDPIDITALTPSGTPKPFFAQHVRNGGAYLFDRVELTPQLEFIPGLRRSEYTTSQAGTPNSDVSRTSPSASLSYRLLPNTSVYASYVEALESEGSAPATAENANQVLPAGVSRQEEIGIRTQFANNTLVSIALFNLRQPSADTNAENVFVLNGNARYRGIETSLQGDVTRDLSITASAVYLDATQVDSPDPTLVGKTPENAAHVTASLFADYRVPGVAGLSISGGMYYIGPRAVNDLDQASIGGYTLFTAGLSYSTRLFGKRTTFQANLENAANKRYWSAVGSNQIGVGLSRSLELSSTIAF
ncbi:MAG: TonB-dependent receptor [Pararobbsia sp.]